MPTKNIVIILLLGAAAFVTSCSPKNISAKYYYQNEKVLDRIEESYKIQYQQTPFSIAFTDKKFKTVSIGIVTDTLTYIYQFSLNEPRITDTLVKYHFDAPKIIDLIRQMQSIHCIWINNFDYYVDEKKNSLIFMSIKPVALSEPFSNKKYYTLTYFKVPQHFDNEGRLLDKRKLRRIRKINGEIFRKINDKVCYTISETYR